MRHEENIRLNSERTYVHALAPNVWEEVKEAFRGECELISSKSKMTQLECDEPSAYSFFVNRVPLYGPPSCHRRFGIHLRPVRSLHPMAGLPKQETAKSYLFCA